MIVTWPRGGISSSSSASIDMGREVTEGRSVRPHHGPAGARSVAGPGAQLDVERLLAAVAVDRHGDRVARRVAPHRVDHVLGTGDRVALDADDHVTALDAGRRGRRVARDTADERALVDGELVRVLEVGRHRLRADTEE